MERYAFGVDIGGTATKIGLFSGEGVLLEKREIPTRTENAGSAVLPDAAEAVKQIMLHRGLTAGQVIGIGIGVPGPVDDECVVYRCNNLGWGVLNVKEHMDRLLPEIPVVRVANDANAAALGELRQGGGQGCRSAVLITLGTGVGGGVVLDGRVVAGKNGGAGEIGHITVEPAETESCTCGKYGCLEQYASARGVVRMARNMLAEGTTPSSLREMETFTAREICSSAKSGDPVALAVMDRFGEYMGRAMSFIACTVDPDVFIIGGGMSRAGDLVIDSVLRYYRKYVFHVSERTGAVIARLGNDAGIYGCAHMVLPASAVLRDAPGETR